MNELFLEHIEPSETAFPTLLGWVTFKFVVNSKALPFILRCELTVLAYSFWDFSGRLQVFTQPSDIEFASTFAIVEITTQQFQPLLELFF